MNHTNLADRFKPQALEQQPLPFPKGAGLFCPVPALILEKLRSSSPLRDMGRGSTAYRAPARHL